MAPKFTPPPSYDRYAEKNQFIENVGNQLNQFGNTLMQGAALRQQRERQEMLDQFMRAKEGREQAQFQADYGTPIDPNATITPTAKLFTNSPQGRILKDVPTGDPMPLKAAFEKWQASGMPRAGARPEFMPALGLKQRELMRKQEDDMLDRNFQERQLASQEATRLAQVEATRALTDQRNSDRSDARHEKAVTKYSDTLEKTGIPSAIAVGQSVLNLLPDAGQDVPGYGMAAGALPNWALGQSGRDMRQNVTRLFNIELRDRSGAAVTDPELERLKQEFGQGTWSTEQSLRNGIAMYVNRLQEIARNVDAGFDPSVRQTYQEQGGRDIAGSINSLVGTAQQKSGATLRRTIRNKRTGETREQISNDGGATWQ